MRSDAHALGLASLLVAFHDLRVCCAVATRANHAFPGEHPRTPGAPHSPRNRVCPALCERQVAWDGVGIVCLPCCPASTRLPPTDKAVKTHEFRTCTLAGFRRIAHRPLVAMRAEAGIGATAQGVCGRTGL